MVGKSEPLRSFRYLLFKNEFSRSYGSTTENLSNSSNHAQRAWPEMGVVS
jgi:hypothetical protein